MWSLAVIVYFYWSGYKHHWYSSLFPCATFLFGAYSALGKMPSTRSEPPAITWLRRWRPVGVLALGLFAPGLLRGSPARPSALARKSGCSSKCSSSPGMHCTWAWLLLVLLGAWDTSRSPRLRRVLFTVLATSLVLSLASLLANDYGKAPHNLAARYERAQRASLPVWRARERLDPHRAHVLTDARTYQAFFDFDHVTRYDRLPQHIDPTARKRETSTTRDNRDLLHRLLRECTDYVVVERSSVDPIRRELRDSGAPASLEPIDRDRRHRVFQLVRSEPKACPWDRGSGLISHPNN